jgi:YesN/AraC family two-component response regulator
MVKKHNMSGYSPLVQKVITRVDFDLSADLSLGTVAKDLSVNASYLSSVFRKETGYSYIDYVNRKRMEHAAYLLSDSRQLISSIAQSCGIQDDNYFTKLFKKYNGKTPRQFRQEQGLSARK